MSFTSDETRTLANQAAQSIRLLNHATMPWGDHTGLRSPVDAYDVVASLAQMASMLPQLMDQLSAYLIRQLEHERIEIDGGQYAGDPLTAIGTAGAEMEGRARYAASALADSLSAAQNAIAFARASRELAIEVPIPSLFD